MGKDMNEKMQLVPELRSSHARYPMNRERWIRPADEPETPKADGRQATFIAHPKPPNGGTNPVKADYVWGPGSRGFGYYHLLTKDAYASLASRLAVETAPSATTCCLGRSKEEGADMEDLRDVYRVVVYPRSKSPVPQDAYANAHVVGEGRAGFTPPDDMRWKDITQPVANGKVKL